MANRTQFKPYYTLGELIDKLSILSRKIWFGEEDCISEHRHLEKALIYHYGLPGKVITNVIRLTQANIEIWELENELRMGKDDKYSLEEIGRRAKKIRDYNRKRVEYKNLLTELHQQAKGRREPKIAHRSEEWPKYLMD